MYFFIFFFALASSYLLIDSLFPYESNKNLFMKITLSIGIGIGLISVLFFVSLVFFNQVESSIFLLDVFFILCNVVFYYVIKLRKINISSKLDLLQKYVKNFIQGMHKKQRKLSFLNVSSLAILSMSMIIFLLQLLINPHGNWDAWAVWNMRAKFILRAQNNWLDAFSQELFWSHPDYPILIPGIIAKAWKYLGFEHMFIPGAVAFLFTFATCGMLFYSVRYFRGKMQAYLSIFLLLGTPFFIMHGISLYADIPLGYYLLVAIVLLNLYEKMKKNNLLFLAGLSVGLAIFTKNEGMLFLVSIIISLFCISFIKNKNYFKQYKLFFLSLLPVLTLTLYFKFYIAPPNKILASQNISYTVSKLLDTSRYSTTISSFVSQIGTFGDWAISIPTILFFYLLLLGVRIPKKESAAILFSIITLFIILIGHFFVFIVSPYNLEWHLSSSLKRLFIQLWPTVLFVYLMCVASYETAVKKEISYM